MMLLNPRYNNLQRLIDLAAKLSLRVKTYNTSQNTVTLDIDEFHAFLKGLKQ